MPDQERNLNLFEALELRSQFDRQIGLMKKLLSVKSYQQEEDDTYYRSTPKSYDIENKPADGFDPKELERKLKQLETKRLKLNMAIQSTNFSSTLDFDGDPISLTEALEIRRQLKSEFDAKSKLVIDAAYKQIIHKEKRDIEHRCKHSFGETYKDFHQSLVQLRKLTNQIHCMNHTSVVNFKDE